MRERFLFITIQILAIILFVYLFLTNNLTNNYLWIFTSILITLTLPSLLARAFFKTTLFGFTTVVLFVYFPLAYGAIFLLNKILNISITDGTKLVFLTTLILWNVSYLIIVSTEKLVTLKKTFINFLIVI